MTNRIIIMAGGMSSRMKVGAGNTGLTAEQESQANQRSKALIELGATGRPLLNFLLDNIREAGYKTVYIVTGEDASLFRSLYADNSEFPQLSIQFATQFIPDERTKPFGTADAVFQALSQYPELQNETFAVCNSDNLYSVEALRAVRTSPFSQSCIAYDIDALEFPKERIAGFAIAIFDQQYHLKDIIEKPDPDQFGEYQDVHGKVRVSMNLFQFDGALFYSHLKDCPVNPVRQEKELPTAVLNMLKEYPGSLVGIPFAEHVPDLTSKEDIQKLADYLSNETSK